MTMSTLTNSSSIASHINPFSNLDWGKWLYGLIAAVIGGGATALNTSTLLLALLPVAWDSDHIKRTMLLVLAIFCQSGFMNMTYYLKQNPLPAFHQITEQDRTITGPGGVTTQVRTTQETMVEKAPVSDKK